MGDTDTDRIREQDHSRRNAGDSAGIESALRRSIIVIAKAPIDGSRGNKRWRTGIKGMREIRLVGVR